MIPIEGHANLFRDENSGAIINSNKIEYETYKTMKQQKLKQKNEIEILKQEVFEIKNLLTELINETRRNNS